MGDGPTAVKRGPLASPGATSYLGLTQQLGSSVRKKSGKRPAPRRKPERPPRARRAKNTARNTAGRRGPLRDKQGRVYGGNPGNKGGTGRPSNELRALARDGLYELIPILIRYGKGKNKLVALKSAAELRQIGLASKVEMDTPVSPLVVQITVGPEVAREREG